MVQFIIERRSDKSMLCFFILNARLITKFKRLNEIFIIFNVLTVDSYNIKTLLLFQVLY